MKKLIVASAMVVLMAGCDDGGTNNIDGLASCTVFEDKPKAYTIECPDGTTVTIHDGKDGQSGINGQNGKDGEDGTNGTDGQNGKDGANGTDGTSNGNEQNGTSVVDSLVAKNTSCTIKDNKDSTHTIVCPDGTSATINNGAVGNVGTNTNYNSVSITLSTFDMNYNTSKLLYIYDYKKYTAGMEDSAKIKIYSTSDTAGIMANANTSSTVSSYYEVYYYIIPGESHDNYIHAKDGDTIYFRYDSEYGSSSLTKKVWNAPRISKDGFLAFNKKICYGDSAKIAVSLIDADLTSDDVQLPITINGLSYNATLEGGPGYYSAILTFVTNTSETGRNIYPVTDTANILISYEDESSGEIVSDEARWVFFTKGTVMFDDDDEDFSGQSSITIYLYDVDNSKSTETVWVKNEKSGDSLKVTLNKYSYDYFYGSFYVNNQKANNEHLYVPDTTYITVSYYDVSAMDTVTEQCLMRPRPYSESVSLSFDISHYYGEKDKAQIRFYNNGLESESLISFMITSTSDAIGYRQDAIYYSSYRLDNGLVGFTTGDTRNGFIHVSAKDTVYATYVSDSGKKYVAKAVWDPEL